MRAIAIMLPGMFCRSRRRQHAVHQLAVYLGLDRIAITSRETSEYFIPSVPMPMPSVTVGKPTASHLRP
jgi:hypothetical protein